MDDVLVLGGGASGMAAAIEAGRLGVSVRILEKKERLGKKLLLTGNGKCNYSNFYLTERNYRGHAPEFVLPILHRHHTEDMLTWFETLGMLSTSRDSGLYPATERAETVTSILIKELNRLGVKVDCGVDVLKVTPKEDGFTVETDHGAYQAKTVILSFGSEAGVQDARPFRGASILKALGHQVYPMRPALVALKGEEGFEPLWAGVRVHASARYSEETETGEVQLNDDGISGIPVLQISRFVNEALQESPEGVNVWLDFLPQYDETALNGFLNRARVEARDGTVGDYLLGWLPKKLLIAVSVREKALFQKKLKDLTDREAARVVSFLKAFPYRVKATAGFDKAQSASGGLSVREVTERLESRLVPGLYVTGELLDVDGMCGGYNLHFAFASGRIAGEEAAKAVLGRHA